MLSTSSKIAIFLIIAASCVSANTLSREKRQMNNQMQDDDEDTTTTTAASTSTQDSESSTASSDSGEQSNSGMLSSIEGVLSKLPIAPCLGDEDDNKRIKYLEPSTPNTREYLQLALAKVMELQRAVKDDTYISDNTSDLGDSDTDEDLMREVLTKVFKDLPGSSSSVSSIIERATRPTPRELERIRAKSIQLSGYDTCRQVTLDFMKNVVKHTPKSDNNTSLNNQQAIQIQGNNELLNNKNRRRETMSTDYEIRMRMLKSLDLHLAVKQRDYTLKLMRI
ncbi:hypothetical protein PV327_009455 [Microctonus hyperodae]|uniref:Uncharacterized protein n=1 Tax=Microctonus hyperodae TaxID=165561 RepID=A0AA39FTU3_MICHY|nr:hypothetical protein PV327_009455 [Microctonus hyperodae]